MCRAAALPIKIDRAVLIAHITIAGSCAGAAQPYGRSTVGRKGFPPGIDDDSARTICGDYRCSDKQRRHEWIACFGNCDLAIAGIHEEI